LKDTCIKFLHSHGLWFLMLQATSKDTYFSWWVESIRQSASLWSSNISMQQFKELFSIFPFQHVDIASPMLPFRGSSFLRIPLAVFRLCSVADALSSSIATRWRWLEFGDFSDVSRSIYLDSARTLTNDVEHFTP
jgi:hypothetical protein